MTKPSELIKRGWCKENYAEDFAGNPVGALSPNAVAWCATGAIYASFSDHDDQKWAFYRTLENLVAECPNLCWCFGIAEWNDNCSDKNEVVEMLEKVENILNL